MVDNGLIHEVNMLKKDKKKLLKLNAFGRKI